ncbi:phage tail protein, partial [Streptomyces sp. NPDC056728]
MSDAVTITVRVNNQTAAGLRDVNGQLRDLQGRFATSAGSMQQSSRKFDGAVADLKSSLISLAPALIPVAAQAAPIAAGLGAAGVATVAFTAAVIPQIGALGDAAKAHAAYDDEVKKSGATSEAAVKKQAEYQRQMAALPPATRQAAGSVMVLSDSYKKWSDGLAKFTMTPVTQGIGITTALLPRLTPLVKSASTQLTRLTTVAGGAIASPGFDALTGKFDAFTNRTLKAATDEALHFMRVLSSGSAHGPLSEVMDYVRSSGPAVRETLGNLAETIGHVMEAAAQAGPGMLAIVNAFAQLVSAVPASLLANLMQVYTAFKLIKLAGVGMGAVAGGVSGLVTKLTALRTAAVGAGGGMAGLRAAFATLGTAAKATVIVAGIAAVALVLTKLSSIGKQAPPDVDRLTTSLGNLGRTGKVTGEAAKAFGKDLGGLSDSLRTLARPSNAEGVQQWLTSLIGMDSTPVKDAKEDLDGVDKALANLVKGGKADLAEAAFNHLAVSMRKQGMSTGELRKQLGDYKSALADQAFEQQLAAESMGLFGTQAQSVQEKLAAQKSAADGLRQSIQALNDVQRTGLGGMIGFEASIDAAAKAARENAGALKMSHGELDLNSDKARIAAGALNDLAAKTDEAAAQARQSTGSWEQSNKIYARGRSELIKQADAMGLTSEQAVQLADSILKIPDKKTRVKMDIEDAKANLS